MARDTTHKQLLILLATALITTLLLLTPTQAEPATPTNCTIATTNSQGWASLLRVSNANNGHAGTTQITSSENNL